MKRTYAILCLLGALLPYWFFLPFLLEHGLNIPLLVAQIFATPTAAFFSTDVLLSSLALWAFIYFETRKRPIKYWWLSVLANLVVGVSLALPLFLLLREVTIEKEK
jgi:hypothetical protein